MSSIRDWMSRRSGPELFFINGIYFGVAMWLISPLFGQRWNLLALSIAGAAFGLFATIMTLYSRRRLGGNALVAEINSAIKSGQLPDLIVPTLWLTQLETRLSAVRRARVATPISLGVVIVCEVATALLTPQASVGLFVLAGLVAIALGLSVASSVSAIPKIQALEQKVRDTYNIPKPEPSEPVG